MTEPSNTRSNGGVPRWVKTLGLVVLALLAVMIVVMLVSGGGHGPGRHT